MPDTVQLTRVSPLRGLIRVADQPLIDCGDLQLIARRNTTSIQVLAFKNQHADCAVALSTALGIECPTQTGRCNANDITQIAWNGPNQWMIIGDGDNATSASLLPAIGAAVGDKAAVIDQSHGRVGLRLRGTRARAIMRQHCTLDLHPRNFAPGHCALTVVAHTATLLIQVDDAPSYDCFVNRSLAQFFAEILVHCCE